jgi:peptide/nickel transport system permease protein
MKTNKDRQILKLKVMLAVSLLMIILALLGPLLAPHDPLETNFGSILVEPNEEYPLGTDQLGRCLLSRILVGARVSLGMTFMLLGIIFVLGILIGIAAAICGDPLDTIITRLADTVLAFPDIVFAIAVVGIIGPGMVNTLLALSLIWWTKYARLTRILVLDILHETYIDSALMAGAKRCKIIYKYILPNILSPLVIQLALDVGSMMLALAGLSYLGLGVQPPMPEWGNMLKEGRLYIQTNPGLLLYPGVAIFMVVAVFNTLGDLIRDVLDPKEA